MMAGTELAVPDQLRDTLMQRRTEIMQALPEKLDPDRFIMVVLTAVTRTPKLQECSKASVYLSLLESARAGLMPDGKEAALIPYAGQAEFMPMVQGLTRLMLRSPGLLKVESRVVHEGDEFKYQYGLQPDLHHRPLHKSTDITHAYAVLWRQGTDPTFEVVTREEIEQARLSSRAPDSPAWGKWYGEMARKVALKRLAKYADLSPEATRAIELDHAVSGFSGGTVYTDGPSDEYASMLVRNETLAGLGRLKERMTDPEDPDLDRSTELDEEYRDGLGADPEPTPDEEIPAGTSTQRDPGQVKAQVLKQVEHHKGKRTHPDLVKAVAWQLGECFAGAEDPDGQRHRLLYYLHGKESTNDLTGAELLATLDWLDARKGHDQKWHPNAIAAQEARRIAREFVEEA